MGHVTKSTGVDWLKSLTPGTTFTRIVIVKWNEIQPVRTTFSGMVLAINMELQHITFEVLHDDETNDFPEILGFHLCDIESTVRIQDTEESWMSLVEQCRFNELVRNEIAALIETTLHLSSCASRLSNFVCDRDSCPRCDRMCCFNCFSIWDHNWRIGNRYMLACAECFLSDEYRFTVNITKLIAASCVDVCALNRLEDGIIKLIGRYSMSLECKATEKSNRCDGFVSIIVDMLRSLTKDWKLDSDIHSKQMNLDGMRQRIKTQTICCNECAA